MQDKKKKTKTQIRIQDLKPKTDIKGGIGFNNPGNHNPSGNKPGGNQPLRFQGP